MIAPRLGLGPSATSQPHLFSPNHADLKATKATVERGCMPGGPGVWWCGIPRGLERLQRIRGGMCRFQARFDPRGFPPGKKPLQNLAVDGVWRLESRHDRAHLELSLQGRWRLRTIAAVVEPQQRVAAKGTRLL